MTPQRPRVLLNFAASIDGKINLAPGINSGRFLMSRQAEDRKRMRALRAQADAILIGAANLRADDPDLAIPEPERVRRRASGEREPLRLVVTTRAEGLHAKMKIFDPARGGDTLVVHTAEMPDEARRQLDAVATLVQMGSESVAIPDLLTWLAGSKNVKTLLCEGGGDLCARLFAARAVDSLYLTVVPRVLGGARAPTLVAGPGFGPDDVPDPQLADIELIGDELFLRYDFRWT